MLAAVRATGPRRPVRSLIVAAGMLLITACGSTSAGISAGRSEAAGGGVESTPPTTDSVPDTSTGSTDVPTTTAAPVTSTTVDTSGIVAPIDYGDNKEPQPYDAFLEAALTDIQLWWSDVYPQVYGTPYQPLEGGIYAARPARTTPIPGCGSPTSSYEDVAQGVAFYCSLGDFIAYDDDTNGFIRLLTDQYGPSLIGVVMAHEFGHGISWRSGFFDLDRPTVAGEQQADCFAGAWASHVSRGESDMLQFTDEDVRGGLSAMIIIRDQVGSDTLAPGGHGTGFDRVGAFQEGFIAGPARCADYVNNPPPLIPQQFLDETDLMNEGNAPYGDGDGEIYSLVIDALTTFWGDLLTANNISFTAPQVVPFDASSGTLPPCEGVPESSYDDSAFFCPSTGQILFDEPWAFNLYDSIGDFAIGYVIGNAWADAVQTTLGSVLTGEPRALRNDCLSGVWTQWLIPPTDGSVVDHPVISAGDLDEVVVTAIQVGDESADTNAMGSAFEKIDNYRAGVLGGLAACDERF